MFLRIFYKKYHFFCILLLIITLYTACYNSANTIFDAAPQIENNTWYYDKPLNFEVDITDTTQRYNVYINIRHAHNYPYANLWVKIATTMPTGKKMEKRIDLPLADAKGEWYGSGLGSVISQQILIQENAFFNEKGKYKFEIVQDMRMNPLPAILNAGIRIEKYE